MTNLHEDAGGELENGFRVYRQLNRCRGWQAGFSLAGEKYSRYFPDAAYGSAAAARRAAERFASENRELHQELAALRSRFEVRTNSRSGIPGVSRYEGDGTHGPYWFAYWNDHEGRRRSRRFSVGRLGEEKARVLAIKAREKAVSSFRERYDQVLAVLGLVPEEPEPRRHGRRRRR